MYLCIQYFDTRNINKGIPIVQSFQLGTVYLESSVLTTAQNHIFIDRSCNGHFLYESLLIGVLQEEACYGAVGSGGW